MRTLTILFILFASAAAVHPQAADGSRYIGLVYKAVNPGSQMPDALTHNGGGLIGDIDADPLTGIAMVDKGKTRMLWLEISEGRDSTGVTAWRVKDVLSFPAATTRDYIFFHGDPAIECKQNGRYIPNLVGIGRIFRSRMTYVPSRLWTANLKTLKFEPYSTKGVKCEYSEP